MEGGGGRGGGEEGMYTAYLSSMPSFLAHSLTCRDIKLPVALGRLGWGPQAGKGWVWTARCTRSVRCEVPHRFPGVKS